MKRAAVRRGHRRILCVLPPAGGAIPTRYNDPRSTEGLIDLADVIGAMSDWVPVYEKPGPVAPPPSSPMCRTSRPTQEGGTGGRQETCPDGGGMSDIDLLVLCLKLY